MKAALILFLIFCCIITTALAQKNNQPEQKHASGKSNSVALGIDFPLAEITNTHSFGFGFQFARSKHRLGQLNSPPSSPIGFTYNLGAEYLLGKKDSYNVKYKGYSFAHAFAGLILNAGLNSNISLTAGPSASIYRNSTLWGLGFNFNVNFYLSHKIGISLSLLLYKQSEINSIWIASINGNFSF